MTAGVNVDGYLGYAQPAQARRIVRFRRLSRFSRLPRQPGGQDRRDAWGRLGLCRRRLRDRRVLIGDLMGTAYGDFVQAKVLAPLNMTSSAWGVPMLAGFPEPGGLRLCGASEASSDLWHAYPQLAAAGLWTTPTNIAKLLIEVGNALGGSGTVLTRRSAGAMLSPVYNFQYGLGGAIRNIGQSSSLLFMKSGGNYGFSNWLAFYPELGGGEGLVAFTNTVWKPRSLRRSSGRRPRR